MRPTPLDAHGRSTLRYSARVVRARWRHRLRNSAVLPLVISAVTGIVVGLITIALHELAQDLHRVVFDLAPDSNLSAGDYITPWRLVVMPVALGLVTGLVMHFMRSRWPQETVDPIEANALFGGRMPFWASVRVVIATLMANASGAAVGMEAAYSQIGAAIYSKVGQYLRLKRGDLRVITAAGAAAAIAVAFNAPFAGIFYGFELVLGTYTLYALGPVAVGVLSATLCLHHFKGTERIFDLGLHAVQIEMWQYLPFLLIGLVGGLIGIITMRLVTAIERTLRRARVPIWARPAVGGLGLAIMAQVASQALGAGHGAVLYNLMVGWPIGMTMLLLALKVLAAATSLGAGFRGGLFSTSLLMGGLLGALVGQLFGLLIPVSPDHLPIFALVGMGAMGAAIIGVPLTMTMLAIETTGTFPASLGVLTGVIVASLLVRHTFGYSFATWRFHVRGIALQGAHDVGWIGEFTAGRLMRGGTAPVKETATLCELRRIAPPGSDRHVFVTDAAGRYAGTIDVSTINDRELDEIAGAVVAADLTHGHDWAIERSASIRAALSRFAETGTDTLPVIESTSDRRLCGLLSESQVLRRYAEEIERRRSDELGERGLYRPISSEG